MLLIAAVLATLVYALILGVKWLSPKIENDLTNRLTTELAQSGQLWANPEVEGRNVTLLGQAPNAEAQTAARNAVARVFGIAQLADLTTLPGQEVSGTEIVTSTTPIAKLSRSEARAKAAIEKGYELSITKDANTLTLSGAVADESDKALLLRLAELHFPEATLNTVSLTVVEGAPAGWRSAAGTVLFNLANLEHAEAKLLGREIMVSGTVLAPDFASSAEESIRAAVPEQYHVAFAVETKAPVVEPQDVLAAVEASATVATPDDASAPKTEDNVAALPTDSQLNAIEPAAGTCATLKNAEREVLHFAFDSAKIRATDAGRVTAVATELRNCANGKLQVQGYTDKTGSGTYNQWLSQQRAEAAVRALLKQGAKREQMEAKGFGETTQFGAQTSKATRAENRRVMFKAQ